MSLIPDDNGEGLAKSYEFVQDLFNRRKSKKGGCNNIRIVELKGGRVIEPTAFEPDARTHRGEYYYNAITNALYRKIVTKREPGIIAAHWVKISD